MKRLPMKARNVLALAFACSAALVLATGCGRTKSSGSDMKVSAVSQPAPAAAPARASDASGLSSDASAAVGPNGNKGTEAKATSIPAGQMTAAEWNDLKNWDFWTKLMKESEYSKMPAYWGLQTQGLVLVDLTTNGSPAADVAVTLRNASGRVVWESRSDNKGRAALFANAEADPLENKDIQGQSRTAPPASTAGLTVECQGVQQPVVAGASPVHLNIPAATAPENVADVMFMIDATGSMGDELSYIKTELTDVVQRVTKQNEGLRMRISCNVYRDHGDEYVVRSFPFTESVEQALAQLEPQEANGGGDYEEAVEDGLYEAVFKHEWSPSARTRIAFLILDAPPHYLPENIRKIQRTVKEAAKQGIRIVPIVASGANKDLEFLMRLIGIQTGATYVFITDDSGIGEAHLQATVGPHKIEFLNNLIVRLVGEYVATGRTAAAGGEAPGIK